MLFWKQQKMKTATVTEGLKQAAEGDFTTNSLQLQSHNSAH